LKLKAKLKNLLDLKIGLTREKETTRCTRVGRELSLAVEYDVLCTIRSETDTGFCRNQRVAPV